LRCVVAIAVVAASRVPTVGGEIVRYLVTQVKTMLAAETDEREDKLANQNRAADDGAYQKKRCHGRTSQR
jgi:hypothetical protein